MKAYTSIREETIYRSGFEIRAEKHDTRRISPDR